LNKKKTYLKPIDNFVAESKLHRMGGSLGEKKKSFKMVGLSRPVFRRASGALKVFNRGAGGTGGVVISVAASRIREEFGNSQLN
jgi:hypothetical protein